MPFMLYPTLNMDKQIIELYMATQLKKPTQDGRMDHHIGSISLMNYKYIKHDMHIDDLKEVYINRNKETVFIEMKINKWVKQLDKQLIELTEKLKDQDFILEKTKSGVSLQEKFGTKSKIVEFDPNANDAKQYIRTIIEKHLKYNNGDERFYYIEEKPKPEQYKSKKPTLKQLRYLSELYVSHEETPGNVQTIDDVEEEINRLKDKPTKKQKDYLEILYRQTGEKPRDIETKKEAISETKRLISVKENSRNGG